MCQVCYTFYSNNKSMNFEAWVRYFNILLHKKALKKSLQIPLILSKKLLAPTIFRFLYVAFSLFSLSAIAEFIEADTKVNGIIVCLN